MITNIRRSFLLIIGLLFCLFGCDPQRGGFLVPDNILSEDGQSPAMESGEVADAETTFEQNLLPLLTAKCAYAGCHVAGGPKNLDFSTYQTFIKGVEMRGPYLFWVMRKEVLLLKKSSLVECLLVVRQLSNAEIQHFINWIDNHEAGVNEALGTDKVVVDEPA